MRPKSLKLKYSLNEVKKSFKIEHFKDVVSFCLHNYNLFVAQRLVQLRYIAFPVKLKSVLEIFKILQKEGREVIWLIVDKEICLKPLIPAKPNSLFVIEFFPAKKTTLELIFIFWKKDKRKKRKTINCIRPTVNYSLTVDQIQLLVIQIRTNQYLILIQQIIL